jgi:hypothetical protein
MPNKPSYPLHRLIEGRRAALGLARTELLRRMGYKSISKGIRRLEAIKRGDLSDAQFFHAPLAQALEVEPEVVEEAFQATRDQLHAERDAAYRAAFRPNLVWATVTQHQDWQRLGALYGGYKRMRCFFQPGSSPATFVEQAKAMLPDPPDVLGYGRIEGFVINFSPDEAVRYDLEGRALACLPKAAHVGQCTRVAPSETSACRVPTP